MVGRICTNPTGKNTRQDKSLLILIKIMQCFHTIRYFLWMRNCVTWSKAKGGDGCFHQVIAIVILVLYYIIICEPYYLCSIFPGCDDLDSTNKNHQTSYCQTAQSWAASLMISQLSAVCWVRNTTQCEVTHYIKVKPKLQIYYKDLVSSKTQN